MRSTCHSEKWESARNSMNRRGFISMLAGAAGAPLVPWRQVIEPLIVLPAKCAPLYQYQWSWLSGGERLVLKGAVIFAEKISAPIQRNGVLRCTVTDTVGRIAVADALVRLEVKEPEWQFISAPSFPIAG